MHTETGGGRGPESRPVAAIPGPVPGGIDWTTVTAQDPGNTVHFPVATGATHYRVYSAALESQLLGTRPNVPFEEADGPPFESKTIPLASSLYYRVFAMNGTRIGAGGPLGVGPSQADLYQLAAYASRFGRPDNVLVYPAAAGASTQAFGLLGTTQTLRVAVLLLGHDMRRCPARTLRAVTVVLGHASRDLGTPEPEASREPA